MPQYIALVNWTDQGAQKAVESVGRAKAFENMATEMGCKVHGLFYTMGQYDLAIRVEAPDRGDDLRLGTESRTTWECPKCNDARVHRG